MPRGNFLGGEPRQIQDFVSIYLEIGMRRDRQINVMLTFSVGVSRHEANDLNLDLKLLSDFAA